MARPPLTRRTMLQGTGVAVATAFLPACRRWSSGASSGSVPLPQVDGRLLLDPPSLEKAADDYGHFVHQEPWVVLVPGSVEDIVKMVRFAREHRVKVAASRGLGESHNTQGHAQVDGGIVIDMSALATIHEVGEASAWVDAGVRWHQLLQATLPLGRSPPTLTDYIELSIGGTLSVGGISGQTFRHGMQVDNVLELEVVTGQGELVRCSPTERRELFDAVRGGLGQFGIIVRARVRLMPVPPRARTFTAVYTDLGAFLEDQKRLIARGQLDYVEGLILPANGGRAFLLEGVKYFAPGAEPEAAALLSGLSLPPGAFEAKDGGFEDFAHRLDPGMAALKEAGVWGFPHPWLNVFVPGEAVAAFVQQVLDETPLEEQGRDPVLLYPFLPDKLTAPFVRVPSGSPVFLFSLLRTAIPPTLERTGELIAKNRRFIERLAAVGGRSYAISSGPKNREEWRAHFHPVWESFERAKQQFDPEHILTPGIGVF